MHKANKLRELRKKQADETEAARQAAGPDATTLSTPVPRTDEPVVATTPFQATRILRAFHVLPERGATLNFWTRLNVDLTRESVRGTCHLPHGLRTQIRVLAFCPDDEAEEMIKAGADIAGISEPIRRINQGWLGFDRCLATPTIMPQVMKVARVLGPKKMMPNPKSGTVVQNLRQAIKEAKGGTLLEYRAEGVGELRATIADEEFSDAKVLDNLKFLVQALLRARPRSAAGAAKAPPKPLIPGSKGAQAQTEEAKDSYFLEATLQLGSKGPPVRVDPESMLPASVGYFR